MAAPTSLVVHHLNDSRSQRVLWLLEELEVPYTIKQHTRNADHSAPKELLDIHPLGKAPVITDGDVTVAESGAIVDYIIHKYGGDKVQVSAENRLDDVYWSHYAEGSLMPHMVMKRILTLVPDHAPFLVRPVFSMVCGLLSSKLTEPALAKHSAFIESYLEKHPESPWLAHGTGPTAADYMMLFPLEAFASNWAGTAGPKVAAWVEMVHARPAYKRALEKGGPYFFA